jgi:hypothetical protein
VLAKAAKKIDESLLPTLRLPNQKPLQSRNGYSFHRNSLPNACSVFTERTLEFKRTN